MPTEIEVRVMKILTAIEIPPTAAQVIEALGNEAVTVVCEAALGSYPGLRLKVRNNAVSLLGWMTHPQAKETIPLLVNDSNDDVKYRAMRAAGRQKNEDVVETLGLILKKKESPPLAAAEAVNALIAIGSSKAQALVTSYETANPDTVPHRGSAVVNAVLKAHSK